MKRERVVIGEFGGWSRRQPGDSLATYIDAVCVYEPHSTPGRCGYAIKVDGRTVASSENASLREAAQAFFASDLYGRYKKVPQWKAIAQELAVFL